LCLSLTGIYVFTDRIHVQTANVVILPGVHIGDGVIVGENSVVGSDEAPCSVIAGNPARLLRKRFDDELTELLLKFRW
jgi:virginiamycin A acetyltransferase